jgi:phage tail-like protein
MTMVIEGIVSAPVGNGTPKSGEPPSARAMGAHAACRFYVEIGTKEGSPIQAVFTEVSGLQVEMQVTEYEEGGTNTFIHKLPGRLKVGNVTLKRGLTRSNDFLAWCVSPTVERRNVTVVMYDVAGKPVIRWNFTGAFPVKWTGPQFTADSNAMAIESIEIAHRGIAAEPA